MENSKELSQSKPSPLDKLNTTPTTEHTDRITIGLYGIQTGNTYAPGINVEQQIKNIKNITKNFVAAADKHNPKRPLEIVVSIYLKPDWKNGETHITPSYLKAKEALLMEFKKALDLEDYTIKVEDFYEESKLTEEEKGYLEHLESKGSIADMIKTHAIIREDNRNRRHLQLDSNTLIPDFEKLYNNTFASTEQVDALNASYYDTENRYVSAHNKIVYTTRESQLAQHLENVHLKYVGDHKDDHNYEDRKLEKTVKNSIYSRAFTEALKQAGLTKVFELQPNPSNTNEVKKIYAANLDSPVYRLTGDVITAVNMSWRDKKQDSSQKSLEEQEREKIEKEITAETEKKLASLSAIKVGKDKAEAGYPAYLNAVKKYTDETLLDYSQQGVVLYNEKTTEKLLKLSDQATEKRMVGEFIYNVRQTNPMSLLDVVKAIPATVKGNKFVSDMALHINGMQHVTDVQGLHDEAKKITSNFTETQELTETKEPTIQNTHQ